MNGPTELIALIDQRVRAGSASTRALGTCVDRTIIGPGASVTFDGSTVAVPVKVLGHVEIRPGMRCTLDKYGSEWLVTGAFANPQLGQATNFDFLNAATTTSASFADHPIATFQYIKFHDNSLTLIQSHLMSFSTANATIGRFAIRLTQTDGDTPYTPTDLLLNKQGYSTANSYVGNSMIAEYTGIPAGTYTCQLRWRRESGAGTMTTDATCTWAVQLRECVNPSSPYV